MPTNWVAYTLETSLINLRSPGGTQGIQLTASPTGIRSVTLPDVAGEVILDNTIEDVIGLAGGAVLGTIYAGGGGPNFGLRYQCQLDINGNGPTNLFTVPTGYVAKIADFTGVATTAAAGATVQLFGDVTAISDALDVATDNAVARAATLTDASLSAGLAAGTVVNIVGTNAPIATVVVDFVLTPV